jgi:hypothetical protein
VVSVRRELRVALFVAAIGALPVGCQVVAGIEHVAKERLAADGGPAGSSTGPSASDPCKHARPPAPPDSDDDRDTILPPFFLAVRKFSSAATGDGYHGFDLDNVCTCDKRPDTFKLGVSSCAPKGDDCDIDGGIDNAGAKLFGTFAPLGYSPDQSVNGPIDDGSRGLLLYVTKYNGKPNDSEVFVGGMLSHGILDGSGCATTVGPNGRAPPGWCGHDRWTYPSEYVKNGTKEPSGTGKGYVTNGSLVFQSEVPITMGFASATMSFGSPIVAGQLGKKPDGTWTYDAVLAGRVLASEMLAAGGTFPDPLGGTKLCQSAAFGTARAAFCAAVDINHSSSFDFKEGPCDAVSMAFAFTAEQADVGELLDEPATTTNPCAASAVPPGTYDCP